MGVSISAHVKGCGGGQVEREAGCAPVRPFAIISNVVRTERDASRDAIRNKYNLKGAKPAEAPASPPPDAKGGEKGDCCVM